MPIPSKVLRASWSHTLRLPKSSFPARPVLEDRPKYLKQCTDDLYAWQRNAAAGGSETTFTLHDGPPYANGSLHIGHALNKILKDIICRCQLAQSKRIDYTPGWDCHGLPIELKAAQKQEESGAGVQWDSYTAPTIRDLARKVAAETVSEQKSGFRKWGIMADWDNAWTTMDPKFEIGQLKVFKMMVKKGLIYRRFKPVYWSPSTRTALAEAELEYKDDHTSEAALVKFPISKLPANLEMRLGASLKGLNAAIWTTTPWTIPANKAIAINSGADYLVVESTRYGSLLIAAARLPYIEELCQEHFSTTNSTMIRGSELIGTQYWHQAFDDRTSPQPILHADFVTTESGSGLVHLAPGHGMDDYKLCQKYGIGASAPVDSTGCFTHQASPNNPALLLGKPVLSSGNKAVLEHLIAKDSLVASHKYKHKYPYDWRSKQPVIIRATEQWFADVGDLQPAALEALERVKFIPQGGRERLVSFVRNRSEWCISRQRAWGVPIPALYRMGDDASLMTPESVEHIISVIEDRGIDAWWTDEELDPAWVLPSLRNGTLYRRGKDTMDVWFDSGTSWTQMNASNQENRTAVADVYIEGTDQHRGWFQSSLLTSVACQVAAGRQDQFQAPYVTLITHGFTLDKHGKKMSKSIGNVVSPNEVMEGTLLPPIRTKNASKFSTRKISPTYDALGPDALRLWAAGCDYTGDVVVSETVLKAVNNSLSKLRVTFKLLLGLLDTHESDRNVSFGELCTVDQIALIHLKRLTDDVGAAYRELDFHKAVGRLNLYVNTDLSAFYIESIKDRLYAAATDSQSRVYAQIVLWEIFKQLSVLLAPVTPLLVEEACGYLPKQLSFHPVKACWGRNGPPVNVLDPWSNHELESDMPYLAAVNTAIKAAQELARTDKKMGSSLQSFVLFEIKKGDPGSVAPIKAKFDRYIATLSDILVVSNVTVGYQALLTQIPDSKWSYTVDFKVNDHEVAAHIYEPQLAKCARCWKYNVEPEKVPEAHEDICPRCSVVIEANETEASKDS
jgi:isoleucyl-tRNA synthetase